MMEVDAFGMEGMGSLDVLDGMENDPEVERKGSASGVPHMQSHAHEAAAEPLVLRRHSQVALTPTVSPPTAGVPPNAAMACGAAAEYAAEHWNLILRAVAAPANGGGELRLLADEDMEDRLHKIFEQNFGGGFGLDLTEVRKRVAFWLHWYLNLLTYLQTSWEALHGSEQLLAKWREILGSFEGQLMDGTAANMLTLMRASAFDDYEAGSAMLVVP